MKPDQILRVIEARFPNELEARRRSNPDGWSFFVKGTETRVFRAVASSPDGATKLKLAATSRKNQKDVVVEFHGSEQELIDLVKSEIKQAETE